MTLLGLSAGLAACRAAAPPSPDIVLVTIDTLRADRLGSSGYAAARTGALDALAARGTRLAQATTPFPRTTPALASLLTGLRPAHHGSREVGDPMTTDAPTLAEVLSVRGYRTLALSASAAATARHGLARGFDVFETDAEARGDAVTQKALDLVARQGGSGPLFLWVHYVDPHFPYDPPDQGLPRRDACTELYADLRQREHRLGLVYGNGTGEAAAALPVCAARYDAEVAFVDAAVGALLAGLGRRAEGLVVVTADHGEQLGEQGVFYEHGPVLHDASLRVPWLVAGPGIAPGHVDLEPARLEDLMPTLLAWLEVPAGMRPRTDGVDLGPRLRGAPPAAAAPVALAESGSALHLTMTSFLRSGSKDGASCVNHGRWSWCATGNAPPQLYDHHHDPGLQEPRHDPEAERLLADVARRWPVEAARQRAARSPGFKLVERPAAAGGWERALYDLRADPGETHDVAAEHPEELQRLGPLLDRFGQELGTAAPALRTAADLEALRRLGYVE